MSATNTAETATLDAWFGATTLGPATWQVAAYTAAPGETGGGTEVSGNGYARVSVTNNTTNFPAATAGAPSSKTNGTAVTFPTSTGAWGTIVALGFHTAAGDNLRFYLTIQAGDQQNINGTNQQLNFPASSLTITCD